MPQPSTLSQALLNPEDWDQVCELAEQLLQNKVSDWLAVQTHIEKICVSLFDSYSGQFKAVFSCGEGNLPAQSMAIGRYAEVEVFFTSSKELEAIKPALAEMLSPVLKLLFDAHQRWVATSVNAQLPVIIYQAAQLNGRWVLTYANQALADFLGVDTFELIGARAKQLMSDFIHPEDLPRLLKIYDLARTTTGQLTLKYRLKNSQEEYVRVTERVSFLPDNQEARCNSVIWHRQVDQQTADQELELFKQIEHISQDLGFTSGIAFIEQFCLKLAQTEHVQSTVLMAKTQDNRWQVYAHTQAGQLQSVTEVTLPETLNLTDLQWNLTEVASLPVLQGEQFLPKAAYQTIIPLRHDSEKVQAVILIGARQPLLNAELVDQMIHLFAIRLLREIEQIRIAESQNHQYRLLVNQKHQLTQMVSLLGLLDTAENQQSFLRLCQKYLQQAFAIRSLDWCYWSSGDWLQIISLEEYHEQKWFRQCITVQNHSEAEMNRCRRSGELSYSREAFKTYWPIGNSAAGYLIAVICFDALLPDDELIQFSQNALALAQQGLMQRENLRRQAMRDSLTGLGNRVQLHAWMKSALPKTNQASLLLFDLNRFKEINDSFGHQFGDKLLQEIGPRIARYLIRQDHYLSRLGGDEFALFLPNVSRSMAMAIAQKLHQNLAENYIIDGLRFQVEASVGVAHFPEHGRDGHELLRCSDVAMYAAKSSNRNVVSFDASLDNTTPLRIAVLSGLDEALTDNQLWVAYQPLMSTKTGQVAGFEALIRWTHPTFGPLAPDQFIQIAEMGEGIRKLTYFVLRQTMANLVVWRQQVPELHVAVNVSPRVLLDHQFPITIEEMLHEFRLPGGSLILELTESTLLVDPIRAVEIINSLDEIGVKVEIDDFGTGYSSLAYLKSLPISALKIDRSFVTDIMQDTQNEVIVASTVQMAHNLGLLTVAEGVEDEATLLKMMRLGCDMIQGYYYAKPIAGDMVSDWLERNL